MNFVSTLLEFQNQLRIFHWQTEKFSMHKALGDAYEQLDDLIDTFIEVFMGKYGKIQSESGFSIVLKNFDGTIDNFINSGVEFFTKQLPSILQPTDTDLLNIRDSMLEVFFKLKYLMTLD